MREIPVSVKNTLPSGSKLVGQEAFGALNQGVEGSFCCLIPGQRTA